MRPVAYDPHRLEGIAHHTRDLIDSIKTFDDFDAAVADFVRIVAFTARRRAAKWRIVDPKVAASELVAHADAGSVAMVFGREYFDRSIRDAQSLQDEFDIPVLAEIPRIHDAA